MCAVKTNLETVESVGVIGWSGVTIHLMNTTEMHKQRVYYYIFIVWLYRDAGHHTVVIFNSCTSVSILMRKRALVLKTSALSALMMAESSINNDLSRVG